MLDELNADLDAIQYWQNRWHSGADWIAASQGYRAMEQRAQAVHRQ